MSKEWAWSYSRKKNYDTCPKRHYEVDVAKNYKDETEQLKWGNTVHEALAKACAGLGPLPDTMAAYQKWVDVVRQRPRQQLATELKFAITRQFEKTDWFASNVWLRTIVDLLTINGDTAAAIDWKTGKVQHDSIQLMLVATCVFAHYPEVNTVNTRFIWLKDGVTTREVFHRATIMKEWTQLIPQLNAWQDAAKRMDYPARPSYLCRKHCPVVSCEHNGRR